ncbi:dimethylaniline monooxygenase (N-oxide forming) [Elsinoe ampelina]|uniref:Dimethylaniline monooxygenase (N-oxide forming) n=1 Tax=Elsinoe ampelina TaxID=302913 RepID=A0A6A6G962_9PEZI|nr:dimethylaniline monooxygenase (N-oxide forming) [Elsinoe ampelina]
MHSRRLDVKKIAVIGAGVSGVAAAIHLKKAGLDVTVYERTRSAGGVWVFNENRSQDPSYPSTRPSAGDVDESALRDTLATECLHAPPAAAYRGLKNNVSTVEMEMQSHPWNDGTEDFVNHKFLAEYISDAAEANGVLSDIQFGTRVSKVSKFNGPWLVEVTKLEKTAASTGRNDSRLDSFDAVVMAVGHYHACNVPDIPGLAEWKQAHPDRVFHSKAYRYPEDFAGQSVLLVGAGVSSTDIAKEISPIAKAVYQVSRGGQYDIPATFLPPAVHRIGPITSFDKLASNSSVDGRGPIPGTVTLQSGEKLCDIDKVILATGYHVSFPFLKDLHADGVAAKDADDKVLVTDGQQTHNLHKDIFYIPDPTLAVVGAPYHVATFSLFEFQAVALAAVYAGLADVPSESDMRREYQERLQRKGAGRSFHSLKGEGEEIAYVNELVAMVNGRNGTREHMRGHSAKWHRAYQIRLERLKAMRNPAQGHSERPIAILNCS